MFPGMTELLIILLIVFVVFGAGKLPKVMGQLGEGVSAFKKSADTEATATHAERSGSATPAKKKATKTSKKTTKK